MSCFNFYKNIYLKEKKEGEKNLRSWTKRILVRHEALDALLTRCVPCSFLTLRACFRACLGVFVPTGWARRTAYITALRIRRISSPTSLKGSWLTALTILTVVICVEI